MMHDQNPARLSLRVPRCTVCSAHLTGNPVQRTHPLLRPLKSRPYAHGFKGKLPHPQGRPVRASVRMVTLTISPHELK